MDWTTIVVALIASLPPTVLAAAAWRSAHANIAKADEAKMAAAVAAEKAVVAAENAMEAKAVIVRTEKGVFELGKAIDGRLSQLLLQTEKAARSEGRLEGQQETVTKNGDAT